MYEPIDIFAITQHALHGCKDGYTCSDMVRSLSILEEVAGLQVLLPPGMNAGARARCRAAATQRFIVLGNHERNGAFMFVELG